MPATVNGGGDVLARGGVRATFRSPNVSAERWAEIFGEESGPKLNIAKNEESKQNKRTKSKRVRRVENTEKK
jgi:hypothetical protein